MVDLRRLFAPRRIAVIGGGAWAEAIAGAAARIGFSGELVPVHPRRSTVSGLPAVRHVGEIDGPIDAAFVGVNRAATIEVIRDLAALGAGGAVCFASGFSEAIREDAGAGVLQARLVEAAGEMPLLGPNCYGFVNALDRAAIWPDQHGMRPVERGVAILTQSSNIAINMTMQRRSVPLAMTITCGNMAQISQAAIARALLNEPRISTIGLHVEGFGDLGEWEALAAEAWAKDVPLVVLKVGKSEAARAAAMSHTAALAGSDAGAQAFLDRLGIPRAEAVADFLEALKLLHVGGRVTSRRIAGISCSGGEASLVADLAGDLGLDFPALDEGQETDLRATLGERVALSNPLDYHTYVWRNADAMAAAWSAVASGDLGITLSVVDYPHTDASDWRCATEAAKRAANSGRLAVVASLPELMPEDVAQDLSSAGVAPLYGLREGLMAVRIASGGHAPDGVPVCPPGPDRIGRLVREDDAKDALALHGLVVPQRPALGEIPAGCYVVKTMGLAHKTEVGAVRLNVPANEVAATAAAMAPALVEEMVSGGLADLLIGIVRDPAHGFVLTLGAGGVMAELIADTVSLLVPASAETVVAALGRLRVAPLLTGYRGRSAADLDAAVAAIMAVQAYVLANADRVVEVEINPLIAMPDGAVAVDALIREE